MAWLYTNRYNTNLALGNPIHYKQGEQYFSSNIGPVQPLTNQRNAFFTNLGNILEFSKNCIFFIKLP